MNNLFDVLLANDVFDIPLALAVLFLVIVSTFLWIGHEPFDDDDIDYFR